jgi:hypothetical protein
MAWSTPTKSETSRASDVRLAALWLGTRGVARSSSHAWAVRRCALAATNRPCGGVGRTTRTGDTTAHGGTPGGKSGCRNKELLGMERRLLAAFSLACSCGCCSGCSFCWAPFGVAAAALRLA